MGMFRESGLATGGTFRAAGSNREHKAGDEEAGGLEGLFSIATVKGLGNGAYVAQRSWGRKAPEDEGQVALWGDSSTLVLKGLGRHAE
jgi:hypothetical protein